MILKNVTSDLANKRLDKVASILFQTYSRTQIKKWILEEKMQLWILWSLIQRIMFMKMMK